MDNSAMADALYAQRVASFLLASFPNQPHDPEVFLTQLTILFTGRPKSLLQAMTHPETGLVSQCQFLTVAAAKEWLDKHSPPVTKNLAEHRLLPRSEEEKWTPPTEAERERVLRVWNEAKKTLLAKAKRRKGTPMWDDGSTLTANQQSDLDAYIANPRNP